MTPEIGLWEQWMARMTVIGPELYAATLETLYMVGLSTLFSFALGLPLAILMILTHPRGIRPNPKVYNAIDVVVNLLRSFPFIILLIMLFPLTRLIIGTTIGSTATIFPLTIAAAPFAARIIEGCFLEVDPGVIEAARSFGANDFELVTRVLISEALPAVILNVAVLAITLIGYSAMAGTISGGGLGDLAIKYGYHRFQADVMFYSVVILLVMVQTIQSVCGYVYKRLR
ncbi:MAG: ABC transporter permease [Planctomycetaceae bacterium]|nr:ABC transporter permease [Planctomycetaceae bacterium]